MFSRLPELPRFSPEFLLVISPLPRQLQWSPFCASTQSLLAHLRTTTDVTMWHEKSTFIDVCSFLKTEYLLLFNFFTLLSAALAPIARIIIMQRLTRHVSVIRLTNRIKLTRNLQPMQELETSRRDTLRRRRKDEAALYGCLLLNTICVLYWQYSTTAIQGINPCGRQTLPSAVCQHIIDINSRPNRCSV